MYALSKIGRPSNESVENMSKLLKHKDPIIKLRAIAELSEMGKAAASAVPLIEQLKKDPNKEIRDDARRAVEKISKAKR